jgi:Dynamin family
MRAIEEQCQLHRFYAPLLSAADLDATPSVVLLGQHSIGKTTFIRHLLGRPYPGANVGPEPTTDRFTDVTYGPEDKQVRELTCQLGCGPLTCNWHCLGKHVLQRPAVKAWTQPVISDKAAHDNVIQQKLSPC